MFEKFKPHLIMILVVAVGVILAAWAMAYIKPINPSNAMSPSNGNQAPSGGSMQTV